MAKYVHCPNDTSPPQAWSLNYDLLISHMKCSKRVQRLWKMRLVLLRHLIIEIKVVDLAAIAGALYKDHPELSDLHRPIRKALEFFNKSAKCLCRP